MVWEVSDDARLCAERGTAQEWFSREREVETSREREVGVATAT